MLYSLTISFIYFMHEKCHALALTNVSFLSTASLTVSGKRIMVVLCDTAGQVSGLWNLACELYNCASSMIDVVSCTPGAHCAHRRDFSSIYLVSAGWLCPPETPLLPAAGCGPYMLFSRGLRVFRKCEDEVDQGDKEALSLHSYRFGGDTIWQEGQSQGAKGGREENRIKIGGSKTCDSN